MKKFIINLWFRKIEIKISKLPQEEKIDYLCRLLFKEVDSVYDLDRGKHGVKSFEIDVFETKPDMLVIGGLCRDYTRRINLKGDK